MSGGLLAVLGGVAIGAAGLFVADRMLATKGPGPPAEPPGVDVLWADRFPNVQLQTHDGRTVRFYDDLIKGKTVALNFMYVSCTRF